MANMFSFLADVGNHEQRQVANTEHAPDFIIDTAAVSDGVRPFETGIMHPAYNNGKWVIVEGYNTREEALAGHAKWDVCMFPELPDQLVDCGNAMISSFMGASGMVFKRQ